ncbi:uncharacterized protein LOC123299780 isoform X2 [Chrysoperla carnea]|uniref:uncharacterized protein LOC123299780 isoform X2 n=1 Tax=Chrysoperla carnea TaxID=189513 RepID=UPI001D081610|nr:uncharacterized protein LOC123299780 isoform X2 [Chrysoperla carnea]
MKRLTEEMVIARTKISDLSAIKRLNCWGSELTDVSLLRRMHSVEVLSLSINKINSLVDFQFCRGLQELYVRQNNIKDINEVCYLQELPNLKNLWLGENPCAANEGYRLAVLRALPRLQKLDDVAVTPEELSDANRRGQILVHPEDEDHNHGDYYQSKSSQPAASRRSTPEISPTRLEVLNKGKKVGKVGVKKLLRSKQESPPRRHEPEPRKIYSPEPDTSPVFYDDRRNANNSYENGSPKQLRQYQYDRSPVTSTNNTDEQGYTPDSPKEERIPHSSSVQSVKDYTNGDRYQNYHQSSHRQNDGGGGSDGSNNGHYDYPQSNAQMRQSQREVRDRNNDRCERNSCAVNHRPPFHRRPVTRNSNILSAVLCLVKELDYPSLEVVEMAVRCRMDELED